MHNYYVLRALREKNQVKKTLDETPLTPETKILINKLLEVISVLQIELENLFGERYE